MPDNSDIIKNSVTAGDVLAPGSGAGVWAFNFNIFGPMANILGLPAVLPAYWTYQRDMVLRASTLFESFWASAVAIACTKAASMSFEFDGETSKTRRIQEMMLQWSGPQDGYVPSQERAVHDFSCTCNGEFHEIVRVSNAAGSRLLGLVNLDSMRCQRTGDPEIPVLYRSLDGVLHELHWWQVICMADQPDPGAGWFGVGHCAAERAYKQIFKLAAVEQYVAEKITGSGATEIELVRVTEQKLKDAKTAAEADKAAKGSVYWQGKILIPVVSDTEINGYRIPLKGLPDGFDRKQELDIAQLAYANALGLVLTDLQPLQGQGLGNGSQSVILEEKASGRGQSARRKQLTHQLNELVCPPDVTVFFMEKDLRDEKTKAEISQIRAETRATQVGSGEITAQQSTQMAVDADDAPREFLPSDETPDERLSDEEKPNTGEAPTGVPAAPVATPVVTPKAVNAAYEMYLKMQSEVG